MNKQPTNPALVAHPVETEWREEFQRMIVKRLSSLPDTAKLQTVSDALYEISPTKTRMLVKGGVGRRAQIWDECVREALEARSAEIATRKAEAVALMTAAATGVLEL